MVVFHCSGRFSYCLQIIVWVNLCSNTMRFNFYQFPTLFFITKLINMACKILHLRIIVKAVFLFFNFVLQINNKLIHFNINIHIDNVNSCFICFSRNQRIWSITDWRNDWEWQFHRIEMIVSKANIRVIFNLKLARTIQVYTIGYHFIQRVKTLSVDSSS